ncbi:tetratricopeptide repeat protein [Bremerella sp. JC817]|uniref:tetratricopeptide repeat protein n=1 Tax=Bremerella sp. JC817 TaxID=3231756 RepID=UPI0034587C1C
MTEDSKKEIVQRLFQEGVALHQAGQTSDAQDKYNSVLRLDPQYAGALHLLGVTYQQFGEIDRAIDHIERAIGVRGDSAIYHNNLGVAYLQKGNVDKAQVTLNRAVVLNANYPDAHANLGIALGRLGKRSSAEASLRHALSLNPNHVDALNNLGRLLLDQGKWIEASEIFSRAVTVNPNRPDLQNKLGSTLLQLGNPDLAIECFKKANALDPDDAGIQINLGQALGEIGHPQASSEFYLRASTLKTDKPWWRWKWLGHCPSVFKSASAIDEYRRLLLSGLEECRAATARMDLSDPFYDGFSPPFNLSHHGKNNREIKEKYASLFSPHILQEKTKKCGVGKPRIGFIATHGHEGSLIRGLGMLIRGLDRKQFQVVVLCSASSLKMCQKSLSAELVEWVPLPSRFDQMRTVISQAKCDVLYFRQIGTDPICYFLPFARLAPIQCTSWGSHLTTGIPTVDYFFSSELLEIEHAQDHYTEQLVRFPGLIASVAPEPPKRKFSRADFGLPDQAGLFLIPQRLGKFHPDFDWWLAELLERCPSAYVILLDGHLPYAKAQLQQRLQQHLGSSFNRICFLPPLSSDDLLGLMSVCNAILDIPQYNGSFTTSDAFSVGLPLVTMPGELKVERYGQFFYRLIECPELISRNRDDYLEHAERLVTDMDYQQTIHQQILSRRDILLDDRGLTLHYEEFFNSTLSVMHQI